MTMKYVPWHSNAHVFQRMWVENLSTPSSNLPHREYSTVVTNYMFCKRAVGTPFFILTGKINRFAKFCLSIQNMYLEEDWEMNAISQVACLKSCISLNKRLWAKSFFRFLDRNFCCNDLKIFLHVKQRSR